MWLGCVFLVLVGSISGITGYGTGARKGSSVCLHRLPRHGVRPQTSQCPYVIKTIVTKAAGNYDITVNMTSTNGSAAIKGFVVQLIPEVTKFDFKDTQNPIGKFESNDEVQILSCHSDGDTATHTNNGDKDLVVIRGKIPIGNVHRKILIRATLLQKYDVFWSEVTSDVEIQPDANIEDPSVEWLHLVTNVAKSYDADQDQWDDDIQSRLKLGYYAMVDDWGHLKTKYIEGQLPFKDQFPKTKNNKKHHVKATNESLKENVVEEFLAGNFQLVESVNGILNSISGI
ncbi:putative defense protein Hdd11 [Argopecten irradians]|uniref:putative defense protein Hdd11 n=1 Tax=Argopecten irradians TaxID=31199 RepID=UPI0037202FAE